jgi:hypothetical protein
MLQQGAPPYHPQSPAYTPTPVNPLSQTPLNWPLTRCCHCCRCCRHLAAPPLPPRPRSRHRLPRQRLVAMPGSLLGFGESSRLGRILLTCTHSKRGQGQQQAHNSTTVSRLNAYACSRLGSRLLTCAFVRWTTPEGHQQVSSNRGTKANRHCQKLACMPGSLLGFGMSSRSGRILPTWESQIRQRQQQRTTALSSDRQIKLVSSSLGLRLL